MLPSMGVNWISVAGAYGGYAPVAACTGTVVSRLLFHRLGGYDECLPLYGAAEPEFSVRTWLSGHEIINVAELAIRHRFRPKAAHDKFISSIATVLRRNYLRFACCYLPPELLTKTYKYHANVAPEEFKRLLAELEAGGVWIQRARLQNWLPLDFRWFARRFGLMGSGK